MAGKMQTVITALVAVAVLILGAAGFSSTSTAKRKHVHGAHIGSSSWWRATDRAGRGGQQP